MIIALSGLPGSGKSTMKALLAKRLGFTAYSMGDMRGKMALARGMTIDELNIVGMEHDFTDKEVDDYQAKLGRDEDNFVIDGWLSWHFIPHAVKIFLAEPLYADKGEAERAIAGRVDSDVARYQKWYGVDFRDSSHYDLVVDTTHQTPEEVLETIVKFVEERQS